MNTTDMEPVVTSELVYLAAASGLSRIALRSCELAEWCRQNGWHVMAGKLTDSSGIASEVLNEYLRTEADFAFLCEQGRLSIESRRDRQRRSDEMSDDAQKSTGTSRVTIGV